MANVDKNISEENKYDQTNNKEKETYKIKSYKRRWFILLIIIAANMLVGFNSVCFGQMNTEYSLYFNVTPATVDWLTLGSATGEMITCLVIAVFTLWKLVRLRWWFILLTFCSTTAYTVIWFTILFGFPIYAAIIGQVLMGGCSGILQSVMPLLTATWFPKDQLAFSLGSIWVGEVVGFAIGSITPGSIFTEKNYHELERGEKNHTRVILSILFGSNLILAALLLLLSVFFVENKPPNPPSNSAAERFYHAEPVVKCSWKQIKENVRSFLSFIKMVFFHYSSVGMTISFAITYTLTTLQFMFMSDLMKKSISGDLNSEKKQLTVSSYAMLSLCVGSCFGGLFGGWILDQLKKYKLLLIVFAVGTLISTGPVIAGKVTCIYVLMYIGNVVHGFLVMALLTIANDTILQHLYPADEMAIGAWLISAGSFSTSVIPHGARFLINLYGNVGFFAYYDCVILLCAVIACSVTISHKRLDINTDHKTKNEETELLLKPS